MHSIRSHNPIESFEIAETKVPARGIIVVVGPNSSGKTLLLKDLEGFLKNPSGHQMIVLTKQTQQVPLMDKVLSEIVTEELGTRQSDGNILLTYTFAGQIQKSNPGLSFSDLRKLQEGVQNNLETLQRVNSMLSPCLLTVLDIDARRSVCQHVNRISIHDHCNSETHALFKNREVQKRLEQITEEVLDMAVWLEFVATDQFKLLISPPESKPGLEERHTPNLAHKYRMLIEEGDGYKSFVGMVMSLLLGRRPVTLIDEPELWLHPPQAYEIGRLIGKETGQDNSVCVVATHSSHLLRGILDAGVHNVTILRMKRHHDTGRHPFLAKLLDSDQLKSLLQKPITATESVLDGFFSKGVAIVEAEGDRLVYQAASMGIEGFLRDVHFLSTGGNEAIPETSKLYLELGQKTAAIVDLDTLINLPVSEKLFKHFITDNAIREDLLKLVKEIADENETLPPTESVSTILKELKETTESLEAQDSWGTDLDKSLISKLRNIQERVKKTRRMKRGGVNSYKDFPDLQRKIDQAIGESAKFGLFFVPVGELEYWLESKIQSSRLNKSKWATEAVKYIRSLNDPPSDDVWGFIQKVANYFKPPK